MLPNKVGTLWLVEERDYNSGEVSYSQSFADYAEAYAAYSAKKNMNAINTVSIEKYERALLQE